MIADEKKSDGNCSRTQREKIVAIVVTVITSTYSIITYKRKETKEKSLAQEFPRYTP